MSQKSLEEINHQISAYRKLADWRTNVGNYTGAKNPGFDDSEWDVCNPGWGWNRGEGDRWFRHKIVVPDEIHGVPVSGSRLDIRINSLIGLELYVDGEFVDRAKYWFDVLYTLTESATPGECYVVALRSPRADGRGSFSFAEWYVESVEDLLLEMGVVNARARLIRDLASLGRLDERSSGVAAAKEGLLLSSSETRDPKKLLSRMKDFNSQLLTAAGDLNELTSFLVGHAHIDMNWLWDWEDTVDTCRRTFRSVDRLMDEFPGFIFSQSQAAAYRIMEEFEPEVFEIIRRRVKEGRWDITASTWVEEDLNMSSGESIVRQTTCALNYMERNFGITPRICWCPDTFGHSWTYPQILKKCGIKYYYAHRCTRPEKEHLFRWEAPDGSRVLVFNEGVTYNNSITPELTRSFPKMLKNFNLPSHLVVFGVGDHGGGPTRRDLRNSIFLNRQEGFPRFRHVHAEEFYRAVEDSPQIPIVRDELNFVFEGCYTTHADIKLMNRRGEALLYETEVLASLAKTMGLDYPLKDLERAWRHVLFNQFHDLLDGSAIHVAYEHSHEIYKEATEICGRIASRSEPVVLGLETPKPGTDRLSVFNPMGWERTETVHATLPEGVKDQASVLEADTGKPVPAQIIDEDIFFTATVPSVGYTSYLIAPAEGPYHGDDAEDPRALPASRPGQPYKLENRYFRLTVDPESGTISSLFDKRLNRELVSPGQPINLFQMCYEKPHGMSAWTIGTISRTENLLDGARTKVAYQGPVQATIRVERTFGKSSLKQDIVIYRDIPRIDFVTEIDWQEVGGPKVDSPMLKVAFPWAHSSATCVREIPFGHIQSPTNGREVPSLTFLELPGEGFGVALLNDCKYGHDARGNTVRLTLVRAAYDPDPMPDIGKHHLTYSILPHPGDWKDAEVWKRGHELNLPPRVIAGRAKPARRSWVSLDAQGVDLSAIKCADDGRGIVLRLVEMQGRRVHFNLDLGWEARSLIKCDLRERPFEGKAKKVKSGRVSIELDPYEIGTWRVE